MTIRRQPNIGIVGATGLVGQEFLSILTQRNFPVGELRLFASQNSADQWINFKDQKIKVHALPESFNTGAFRLTAVDASPRTDRGFQGLDVVFFSSGDEISKSWGPVAVQCGCQVIDNSASFRMDPKIPLIVPEVNWSEDAFSSQIISNPNCSTIQLVVFLKPLLDAFGLEEVRLASYQSVSGAGRDGLTELAMGTSKVLQGSECPPPQVFPKPIPFANLPQIGVIDDQGFCTEENKISDETQKILGLHDLPVSVFTVRTPTQNGHSEVVWVRLKADPSRDELLRCLQDAPSLELCAPIDKYFSNLEASGKDPVFVGRIHKDRVLPRTWMAWVVADNLRKGAALNGIQILERLMGQ